MTASRVACGSPSWTRTNDTAVNSRVLYRLSYGGISKGSGLVRPDPSLCWRYLSSRAVSSQVLWAQMSLTAVFGMGTGGPSPQSTPTILIIAQTTTKININFSIRVSHNTKLVSNGDPYGNRTHVCGVRGRRLNRLTNGPLVRLQGFEPGTH